MSDFLNKFRSDNEQSIMDEDINLESEEELIESDAEYLNKQKQKKRYLLIGGIFTLIVIIALFIWLSLVKIPDFNNKNLNYVKTWAQDMQMNVNVEKEYDNVIDENMVIEQDLEPGSLVFKNRSLSLVVSQGADPEEKIKVPNLKTMHIDKVNEWIEANKLDNVSIESVSSQSIGKGHVISYRFDEDFVTRSNFKRKNALTIKVSKGKQSVKKNIVVPNLRDSDKYDVELWAEENKVNVEYIYQTHPKIKKDQIIKQSVKKGKKIAKHSWISVYVSLGKGTKVPDFKKMSMASAKAYTKANVSVRTVYHGSKKYGKFISQSIPKGTMLYTNKKIVVKYSEGRPFIDNIKSYNRKQVDEYFYRLNRKGASLGHSYKYTCKGSNINSQLVVDVVNKYTNESVMNKYVPIGSDLVVKLKKNCS